MTQRSIDNHLFSIEDALELVKRVKTPVLAKEAWGFFRDHPVLGQSTPVDWWEAIRAYFEHRQHPELITMLERAHSGRRFYDAFAQLIAELTEGRPDKTRIDQLVVVIALERTLRQGTNIVNLFVPQPPHIEKKLTRPL